MENGEDLGHSSYKGLLNLSEAHRSNGSKKTLTFGDGISLIDNPSEQSYTKTE